VSLDALFAPWWNPLHGVYARALLSRAKHRSLAGHSRISQRVAAMVRAYDYDDAEFFRCDGAPEDVATRRAAGFDALSARLHARAPRTLEAGKALRDGVSDVSFTRAYRVPFPFRQRVRERLPLGVLVDASEGLKVRDLDGNWSYDLGGSYGVNLLGERFYKSSIARAAQRAEDLGLVLGRYHPAVLDNVRRLQEISGLDEVSFHMSGTEAVMQAVRLARYHTGRSHVVRFCGAYHGWWDGVQPGVGNPRPPHEVYTLKEMHDDTLRALRLRRDIACVLVNPIQAMHPNAPPPNDGALVASDRRVSYDREAYRRWLQALRAVCTERDIPLILDEVFMGFRLARGGAQAYFGVRADMVCYGKSLGGGLPVGVLCGRGALMRRYREERPADMVLARGTFNAHPYVMTAMNEFLQALDAPEVRATYEDLDARWDARAARFNARLAAAGLPVRVANMASVWSTLYLQPGRYNWLLQFYLAAEGVSCAWIGTGRFIFPNDLDDATLDDVAARFVDAAERMRDDGFFWGDPALTNAAIRRRMLREMVSAALPRRASGRASRP